MAFHYLLIYTYANDYLERRGLFREHHLETIKPLIDRGEVLLGGALSDPFDTGLILFLIPDPTIATAFAASDPYVVNGLVTRWEVRRWVTVVGERAAEPISSVN